MKKQIKVVFEFTPIDDRDNPSTLKDRRAAIRFELLLLRDTLMFEINSGMELTDRTIIDE